MGDTPAIKIAALDDEDLAVISAHLQDAVMPVGDLRWMKATGKLAIVANRYVHFGNKGGSGERRLCGVQISRVRRVSSRNIMMNDKTAIVSLLAMTFIPGADAPEGTIELSFAGGGAVRIEVECIEVAMADLSEAWPARARPDHDAGPEDTSSKGARK
ncbi:DUF2948 family protein [Anderseniella sp. Alg231-50]|uniref:DUF2948 family protein n=1 Tax=Anderseniella sp. Alg231-50 TaxID=1922226 RepID=UPI000D5543B8